jgi:hypothetical protein
MAMITWKEDADIEGWVGDIDTQWVLEIYPHAKDGWSWCVITDDAEQNVPEGWDPTIEDAMAHSESAYLDWRDVIEGRKPVDEHDETAEIVADAVAKERAAVVAWLRKEAVSHRRDGFPIAAYTMQERADAIERGEHRRREGG